MQKFAAAAKSCRIGGSGLVPAGRRGARKRVDSWRFDALISDFEAWLGVPFRARSLSARGRFRGSKPASNRSESLLLRSFENLPPVSRFAGSAAGPGEGGWTWPSPGLEGTPC